MLSSYFAYSFLSNGTVPVVPNTIPAEAINAKRCATAAARKPAPAPPAKKPKAARR